MKPSKNIEIKARCANHVRARAAAKKLGARRAGVLHQVDTYFGATSGRLKLREIREGNVSRAELIAYHRANHARARSSIYFVVPVPNASLLKSALAASLGLRAVVRKRRELWLYRNVRIHLDIVEGLGTFLELEAVVSREASEKISHARVRELCEALKIDRRARLAKSYVDLVLTNGRSSLTSSSR